MSIKHLILVMSLTHDESWLSRYWKYSCVALFQGDPTRILWCDWMRTDRDCSHDTSASIANIFPLNDLPDHMFFDRTMDSLDSRQWFVLSRVETPDKMCIRKRQIKIPPWRESTAHYPKSLLCPDVRSLTTRVVFVVTRFVLEAKDWRVEVSESDNRIHNRPVASWNTFLSHNSLYTTV